MIRVVAMLILATVGLAAPAQACGPNAGSTFCADGWVAQSTNREDATGLDFGGQTDTGSDDGMASESFFAGDDGLYIDGAVAVGDPPSEADGQL